MRSPIFRSRAQPRASTLPACMVLVAALALCATARANSYAIDYRNRPGVDPLASFDADCMGVSSAADCDARAALLTAELVDLLTQLEDEGDATTQALFQTALDMNDPQLQDMALRYFARRSTQPASFWDKAQEFFFGKQPTLGQRSAEILKTKGSSADQERAKVYLEGRPSQDYGGERPRGAGLTDSWATASARNAILEDLYAFELAERFPDATRLLMNDRYLPDLFAGSSAAQIPVTAFITDAPVAEVEAHFAKLFGAKPYPASATSRARLEALTAELNQVQAKLLGGDLSVTKRLQELATELSRAQEATTLAARLNLEAMHCADHVFWLDGSGLKGPLPRAVTVGVDALLGRTAIRYFGGERGTGARPAVSGADGGTDGGDSTPQTGGSADDDESDAAGGNLAQKHAQGGCSASIRGASLPCTWLLLGLLGLLAVRGRARTRGQKGQ